MTAVSCPYFKLGPGPKLNILRSESGGGGYLVGIHATGRGVEDFLVKASLTVDIVGCA